MNIRLVKNRRDNREILDRIKELGINCLESRVLAQMISEEERNQAFTVLPIPSTFMGRPLPPADKEILGHMVEEGLTAIVRVGTGTVHSSSMIGASLKAALWVYGQRDTYFDEGSAIYLEQLVAIAKRYRLLCPTLDSLKETEQNQK